MINLLTSLQLVRLEFGLTAMCHFLFVPLALGLPWLLFIAELIYLVTKQDVYWSFVKFFSKFFATFFIINIIAGRVFNFEYANNWGNYLHVIGAAFGHTFFLVGNIIIVATIFAFLLYFTLLNKVSPRIHIFFSLFMAIMMLLYIVNPMALNTWMQNPNSYYWDVNTMTIHISNLAGIYMQPYTLIRILHLILSALLSSSIFVLGISSYYLLKNRNISFATSSFLLSCIVGFIICIAVLFSGDINGLYISKHQPEKMAAIEGQWNTQTAPAAWYVIAAPNQTLQENDFVIQIPYALSLISSHSLTGTVEGLKPLMENNKNKIKQGLIAYNSMLRIQSGKASLDDVFLFKKYYQYIGYYLLIDNISNQQVNISSKIYLAAKNSIPQVSVVFWSFRIMLISWIWSFIILIFGLYYYKKKKYNIPFFYLKMVLASIVIPFIGGEAGWLLAEAGRQPWLIYGILPTKDGISPFINSYLTKIETLLFFIGFCLILLAQIYLIIRFTKKGP